MIDGGPAVTGIAVTPSDTTVLTINGRNPRAFYVGVSGDVVLEHYDGSLMTYKSAPVGILPIGAVRVRAATAASNIVALY